MVFDNLCSSTCLSVGDEAMARMYSEATISEGINSEESGRNTVDFYNKRSRVINSEVDERMVLIFDYRSKGAQEIIDWKYLKELKIDNKWGVLRHPMVLHFVNERLIECAAFYLAHIIAFILYLLLLSSHIFSKDFVKDVFLTLFIDVFVFFLMLKTFKSVTKSRDSTAISWWIVAYILNIATFAATLAYVWLPYLFEYDDFHPEIKETILWVLPIIAIISAWANFLYILRKSPFGIYIFMIVRILKSFMHIAPICLPTMIAFSFAFHLLLKDSDIKEWDVTDKNVTAIVDQIFVLLQAVTKTSTMMIGEVEANDILGTRRWTPTILVLVFEIITVILLMNLMISLAVGDVNELRNTSQDNFLRYKINFVIETLQLFDYIGFTLCTNHTNNVLIVSYDGGYYTKTDETLNRVFDGECFPTTVRLGAVLQKIADEQDIAATETSVLVSNVNQSPVGTTPKYLGKQLTNWRQENCGMISRATQTSREDGHASLGRKPAMSRRLKVDGYTVSLGDVPEIGSGIARSCFASHDESNCMRKFKQWLIGLNWHCIRNEQ